MYKNKTMEARKIVFEGSAFQQQRAHNLLVPAIAYAAKQNMIPRTLQKISVGNIAGMSGGMLASGQASSRKKISIGLSIKGPACSWEVAPAKKIANTLFHELRHLQQPKMQHGKADSWDDYWNNPNEKDARKYAQEQFIKFQKTAEYQQMQLAVRSEKKQGYQKTKRGALVRKTKKGKKVYKKKGV